MRIEEAQQEEEEQQEEENTLTGQLLHKVGMWGHSEAAKKGGCEAKNLLEKIEPTIDAGMF